MPLNYAMFSAVSGLKTSSDGMNVIANNIANANTKSFKTDRAEFEDLLSVTLSENSQLGRGSKLRNISTMFNQGAVSNTGQITDLAVQGEGFFVVKNDKAEVKESDGMFYTRQGSFRFDKDGKLTDISGGRVQGYMADPNDENVLSPRLSDMQIISNVIPPKPTSVVNVVANLDSRAKPPVEEFDVKKASQTSNFAAAVTIYDSFGSGHQANVYFRKADANENRWNYHVVVDGKEIADPSTGSDGELLPSEIGQGEIEFDEKGKPKLNFVSKSGEPIGVDLMGQSDAFDVTFANGAKSQKVQFNFGPVIGEDYRVGTHSSTSIAARSGVVFHSQDGYSTGYLKTLKIDIDGTVRATYTNGLDRRLGMIALASFPNTQGLQKIGKNNYLATPSAGEANIGHPQTGSRGSVYSASLEESNVDLAQQFVDMILTQRGFQANSKAITTSDAMLDDIINLKR